MSNIICILKIDILNGHHKERKRDKGLGGVWFSYFMFPFSLKIENRSENMFGVIFLKTFLENIS